jgi:hypothetical protein
MATLGGSLQTALKGQHSPGVKSKKYLRYFEYRLKIHGNISHVCDFLHIQTF